MTQEQYNAVKKANKFYIIELLVIAVIIIVLATLKITGVIGQGQNFRHVFNIITLVGSLWIVSEFIWMLLSKKKRRRNSMFDKVSLLPFAIAMIVFDIICLINWTASQIEYFSVFVSIAFYYIAVVYIAQAIYHYKHPIPMIIQAALEELEEKKVENKEPNNEKSE